MTHELWARLILALGAVVVVPLGRRLVDRMFPSDAAASLRPIIDALQLPAAALLSAAQFLSPGWIAAAMAAPWLLVTGIIAAAGLMRRWKSRRGTLPEFSVACGLMFLAVGGGWALLDRAGLRPLAFERAIVLLTGIHFHYAGFALPILAALACQCRRARPGGSVERASLLGVLGSVPLVAVGITATRLGYPACIELAAAWCMSLSGLGVAWLYMRLAFDPLTVRVSRELWAVGSLLLSAGMILSLVYGSRSLLPPMWLDIPWMWALHGTANAMGFVIPSLLGWRLQIEARPASQFPVS